MIEVADYRNGKAHEQDIDEDGDYIVVNSRFVSTNGRVKKYSNDLIEPLETGEIAFVLSDVPNGKAIARTFLVDENNKYSLNQRIAGITPHNDTEPYFLSILMNRNSYFLKFDTGVGQTNLSKSEVENFSEGYPNYDEQCKIGAFFKDIDHLITLHQRKYDALLQLKKAYLQNLFPSNGESVPKLRFANFNEDWEQRKAANIFISVSDKGYTDLPVLSASQEFGMIRRDTIGIDIKYDVKSIKNYKRVKPGQFVIHLRSFQGGFAWNNTEGITSPAYTVLDYKEPENHVSRFWKEVLTNPMFIRRLETVTYGIRDGRSISFTDFSSLKFYVPTVKEQNQIATFFDNLDKIIFPHHQKLENLKNLKKAYLQKLFV